MTDKHAIESAEQAYAREDFTQDRIRAAIVAYLSAIAQDEASVEAVARAMLADELSANPRRDFDETWAQEDAIWLSNARAVLAVLLSRAKEQKP